MGVVTWRRRPVGAMTVVALLLAACGSSDTTADDPGTAVVASSETPTTNGSVDDDAAAEPQGGGSTAEPDEDRDGTATAQRDPSAPISADSVYRADAEPLMASGVAVEPGVYRTGALGTPMSFMTTESLHTQPNRDGQFVLTDLSSRAPDDRDLVFMRVGSFSDPGAPNAPIEAQTPWPNDDFRGWLENLHDGVIATGPVETAVNGLPALQADLELSDDIGCGFLPGFCVGLASNNGQDVKALNPDASYRVWIVEQGDEDPLMISAGIARDDDTSWFDRAAAVLDTIAFGDLAPNPVQWLVAGSNRLNALGGVEVDLPANVDELTNGRARLINAWAGRGFWRIPITEQPGAIYFSDHPHDIEGNPLASTEEVIEELSAAGAELTEIEATTIGGVDGRVFDVITADVGAIMLRFSPLDVTEEFFGWDAPAEGRLWLIEHPDRGLMMISTHAFGKADETLPRLNELGNAIVESMTFSH